MSQIQLTLGKWNNTKLAEWFGCSEKTFRNKKRDYLEQLKGFAVFQEEKGKVIITEVINPVFSCDKKPRKSNKKIVKQETNKSLYDRLKDEYGGVIMSDMAKDIHMRKGKELLKSDGSPISFNTIKAYVYESIREQLGRPGSPGPKGSRELIILIYKDGKWVLPTKEEMSERSKIIKKYYSGDTWGETMYNLVQARKGEELSAQDYAEMIEASIDKGGKYELCQLEIEDKIGSFKQKTIMHWLDSEEQASPEVAERIVKFFQ